MLSEAAARMEDGSLSESEVEHMLIEALKHPGSEHKEQFEQMTRPVARLPTDQLVAALNEHLSERRQGNTAYRAGNMTAALAHYERAKAVVELIRGLSATDQAEVDVNRVAVLCNIAAARLATKEYGAASEAATAALAIDPRCVKALARRAKAAIGRHEYDAVQRDAAQLRSLGAGGAGEAALVDAALRAAVAKGARSERHTFAHMFDRNASS